MVCNMVLLVKASYPSIWLRALLLIALLVGQLFVGPGYALASTADHTQFDQLQVKFETGPEVTKACLGCHTLAAKQIHKSTHWTWEYENPNSGQLLGKKHVVNNFCLGATPNIAACSSCHIGYGWEEGKFDFTSEESVDCLVCHETTGLYSRSELRTPGKRRPKLEKYAQSVGPTTRRSCGACHFAGGGAKAVKHGDIDPTLAAPDFFVDVHMDADGLDFSCSTCHRSDQHEVSGSRYGPNANDDRGIAIPGKQEVGRSSCRVCHSGEPHEKTPKLNSHANRIACQTCHIPRYSRGDYATKSWWDWSKAGVMADDGRPFGKEDDQGQEIYSSKKGEFQWQIQTRPEYRWFDGNVRYTLLDDEIDPQSVVPINRFGGDANNPRARIWPVKVMRGKQPYDSQFNRLVAPLTVGEKGYWNTFDWDQAISLGMKAVDKPYSGQYGFVETEMLWPLSHMVAPADEALTCGECHTVQGVLHEVGGVYIPGRDGSPWLDRIALLLLVATCIGVAIHSVGRILMARQQPRRSPVRQQRIYVFKRFERFWHWAQALLIVLMLFTGFEIHGSYRAMGIEDAMALHTLSAWLLIGLWVFAIFWHLTTGEWRHYIPTTDKLVAVARYYAIDMFKGEPHPFRASALQKHNPLQRLAYLLFKVIMAPLIWLSGLLYLFYSDWTRWGLTGLELGTVAWIHTAAAYLIVIFFVGHVYLTTTGHSVFAHIKAMFTGWEEVDEMPVTGKQDPEQEQKASKPSDPGGQI
ncbi:tetrathionate reductase family octaheme c-type cytochrome [Aestuariirhabdus sp. Z084]|uniref:tetrathionate reductase family octaheme c-type cytochrome n=1 Tax=Aestuariirhabdus haliotis TaxID=2918751 RepID=UPI00201B3E9F|nr:tetrathionate reductase family octaheme c-type cytochrome [Aestuariirhabdus haliotis]MCL6416782.1 tetrathionate reductase family octaheme c-type cytochrome [Aestuariirhabdus haliotis]MCL6420753.1 tetrathionate reductase family octaheme c-type cytochrome [Aestuariirhabdus haliotis]